MVAAAQPGRRLVMVVDMEGYSRNDDVGQYHAQGAFRRVMRAAAELCNLDRDGWEVQATGDGELTIFPPDTSEPMIVAEFVPALDRVLRDHNRHAAANARIRIRVAVHQGLVTRADNGFAGHAVVTAARLVDAKAVRDALTMFPDAGVALIVSSVIYHDVISQSYSGIRQERFRRVRVEVKAFEDDAWVFVPDEDINHGVKGGERDARGNAPTQERLRPTGGSSFTFGAVTNNGPTVFGDHGRAYAAPAAGHDSGGAR